MNPTIKSDPELLLIRKRKAELLRQRVSLIKQFGLAYYKPHPTQIPFHEAGIKFKRRLVRTGNRWGKSTAGCAEDVSWLIGERPWYPPNHPFRRAGLPQHPIKLLTITTDWDKVDEIFTSQRGEMGKAWRYLPADLIKPRGVRRNHSGAIDTIELKNGSLWRFDTVKSFMANPQGSESSDWDAIHCDEPLPEAMWKGVSRGLIDRGGSAWFTLTPLREAWINDYFFPMETNSPRSDVWSMEGSTYDNIYLTRENIEAFERDLSIEERQCRILGLPLHLSGLIYKDFKWDIHVLKDLPKDWSSFTNPPRNWPVYFYIDPHPQTPHAVLFATISPQGRHFYFADIFEHCSIRDLAIRINYVLAGRRPIWGKMDPLGFINDPINESNMAEELNRHGVYVEKATKALAQGILRVQGELKARGSDDQPHIYFSPSCKRTLWEIQRYCWDEKDNKPIDKDDHMMENLYRAELSDMIYLNPTAKRTDAVGLEEITRPELNLDDLEYLDSVGSKL